MIRSHWKCVMNQIPEDEASREKLQLLLFQLGEELKDPPIVIDIITWRENVEIAMEGIREVSPYVFERLEDLINEVIRLAQKHVMDIDNDLPPNEVEQSAMKYYQQVSIINSEINAIKSL